MNSTFNPSFAYDLERTIDDFIFLCFFVGNDFLPHIPCLSIREGGIDVLMRVYDYCLKLMPDYLTNVGELNMKSLKIFMKELSSYENDLVSELISK
jgi:5'-3' exoribonuclease 2